MGRKIRNAINCNGMNSFNVLNKCGRLKFVELLSCCIFELCWQSEILGVVFLLLEC